MIRHLIPTLILILCAPDSYSSQAPAERGWLDLFNGQSLDGWHASEHPNTFKVEGGVIVAEGPRSHLFYTGPIYQADFKNFEFRAEVMTEPGANSGIYFHTMFQDQGWPAQGYEVQINHSATGEGGYRELKRTGSLYGVRNVYRGVACDREWIQLRFKVVDKHIQIWVNDTQLVDYVEEQPPVGRDSRPGRFLSRGTFALQGHDPKSKAYFRNLQVRPLPEDIAMNAAPVTQVDAVYRQLVELQAANFPVIDLHVHLKGGLTIEEALTNSRSVGIQYGIAPNCGLGFPITDDQGIYDFIEQMRDYPVFLGMQAEGREWVNLFSRAAISQFDYVFSDAMTFTDQRGKRVRLWIDNEVEVGEKQAFMDLIVDKIVGVLSHEPIDIYVNPTFLPSALAAEYDALWTESRMQRVIAALVENQVALEINSRYHLPSIPFIKRAKTAGVKFTLGTNNGGRDLGRLEYALEAIRECGLKWQDMWVPERKDRNEK